MVGDFGGVVVVVGSFFGLFLGGRRGGPKNMSGMNGTTLSGFLEVGG